MEEAKKIPHLENENDLAFALQRALQLGGVQRDDSEEFVRRIIRLVNGECLNSEE